MSLWDVAKNAYLKVDSILQCAVLYLASWFLDDFSSMHFPPGVQESNPFSRHADGSFWLKHALISGGVNTVEIALISAGLYAGTRLYNKRLATFAAGLPWLYFAYLHLDAAFTNFLYEIPGLYQQTAHDILRSLLGQ